MTIRRNVLTRTDNFSIMPLTLAAAVGGGLAGCHPTGSNWADPALTGMFAAAVVWAAATSPWWVLAAVAGIAGVACGNVVGVVLALAAAGVALWVGAHREGRADLRCMSAALSVQVLLRLTVGGFFGASALLAGAALIMVLASGVLRRPRVVRRRVVWTAAATLGVALLFSAGFAAGAASSKDDLRSGYTALLDGLQQLQSGDTALAAGSLHQAAKTLHSAQGSLDRPWVWPAQVVPVVAQHRTALRAIVAEAATSAAAAADALDVIDPQQLRVVNGVIDVNAVAILAQPLGRLDAAVSGLRDALRGADSPWLVGPVQDRLSRYLRRAEQAAQQAKATSAAARVGPPLLGSEGARNYLVAFTSPAEARGLTGLMGNWAIVNIDNGRLRRTQFGRTAKLVNATNAAKVPLHEDPAFFDRYEQFGAGSTTTPPDGKFWSNATMSPDMATDGAVMAQMFETGMNLSVDGVFVIDPAGLASLLKVTGPITVEGLDQPLDGSNLERFLLLGQYDVAEGARADLLESVAEATLQAVLTSELPAPQVIAHDVGGAATTGHIVAWARRPEEQQLFTLMGIDGALPVLDGTDGLAVVTNNASGNKIDSFLQRTVSYAGRYDSATGRVETTLTVKLLNTAPATGYPDYVIGNIIGLPTGTNRTLLSIYSPLAYTAVKLDDAPTGVTSQSELGWNVYSLFVDIAPGEERTLEFDLSGEVASGGYRLVVRPQPLALPDTISVAIDNGVTYAGTLTRRTILDRNGARSLR